MIYLEWLLGVPLGYMLSVFVRKKRNKHVHAWDSWGEEKRFNITNGTSAFFQHRACITCGSMQKREV